MAKIKFEVEKKFTRGFLEGLVVKDTISFVSNHQANDWIERVNQNSLKGLLNYDVLAFTQIQGA